MRTFIFSDERSHKFWSIDLKGNSFTVTWGKVGTAGQSQVKTFPDEDKAKKEADKLIKEKTGKGYLETTAKAEPAPPLGGSLREALEAAIIADPADRASYAAYADWLSEQNNPADVDRAELIRVQMALEDPSLPSAERKKLVNREQALLKKHQKAWAGDWIEYARYDGPTGRAQHDFPEPRPSKFVRGLPAEATFGELTAPAAITFARSPQTRFLRRLAIGELAYEYIEEEHGGEDLAGVELAEMEADDAAEHFLMTWPHFGNLRVFQLGWTSKEEYGDFCEFQCHQGGRRVHLMVQKMPRLEELYLFAHRVAGHKLFPLPLPNLRVLQIYHSVDYPLEKLAKNASLKNLTHLLFHPHALEDEPSITLKGVKALARSPHLTKLTHLRLRLSVFGDDGVKEIISSGLIDRLKMLDLRHGRVSDKGAKLLAAAPAVRKLEVLDLSRNELTAEGIQALTDAGVKLRAEHQHGSTADFDEEEYYEMQYLFEGDYE